MTISRERITEFFARYVDGWLLSDIRYCADQEKNMSFTVATLVLNAVDFLGSLCAGKRASRTAFEQFLQKYMPTYQNVDLYKTYRCGLVHQYFPKDQHGIVWNKPGVHLINVDGRHVLNAQSLVADLEKAIAAYKTDLNHMDSLQRNFAKRIPYIVSACKVEARSSDGVGRSDSAGVLKIFLDQQMIGVKRDDDEPL
jgi:hypothetical protein